MKDKMKLYVAAIGGAFILVVADLMANIDAATTLKLGGVLEKYIFGDTFLGAGLLGLSVVLLFSAFFCWLYDPEDKVAAFTRGLSVFAVISAVTPYSVIENPSPEGDQTTNQQKTKKEIGDPGSDALFLISSVYAQNKNNPLSCTTGVLTPNAKLISEKYVSSCKPRYSGFLGLGSFFNNTIEYCESQYTIPKNERVKLLQSWETWHRGYRYSEVEFQVGDDVCKGWVSDGRKSVRYVVPE